MTNVAKDPFRILDPAHAAATGVEQGLSGVWKVLTETNRDDPKLLEKLVGAGGRLTGGLAGAAAVGEAPEGIKAIGEIPKIPGKAVEAVKPIPPKVVQGATLAKYAVNKAERLARESAESAQKQFENEARMARLSGRSGYEIAEREIKAKTEEIQKKHEQSVGNRQRIEQENAQIETTKNALNQVAKQSTQRVTQNLQKTLDMAKTSFDSEYEEFDTRILGKSKQFPKGQVQSDLTAFGNAVEKARTSDIQGSEESIKQFNQIMARLQKAEEQTKGKVDTEGGLKPVGEMTIPTVDLRGFITELEDAAYNRNLLPDVKTAVKNVAEAGKQEVMKTVKDVGGASAVNALKDLNSRYSDYLTDWKDTSSTNPLPKVRNILLEGVVRQNPNYPVHLDIARILKGNNATKALELLQKYKKFGADPTILRGYQEALERLEELPKPQKVPEIKTPKYPQPPRYAKIDFPEPPKPKPFERQTMMRNVIEDRLNAAGRIGQLYKLLSIPADVIHGRIDPAMSQAAQMMLIEMVRRAMTSSKMLDYLSKEKP
jgi:hypothetical protein